MQQRCLRKGFNEGEKKKKIAARDDVDRSLML